MSHYGNGGDSWKHRKTGRNIVPLHQCGICGKTFVSNYYLDLHMHSKHALPSAREGDEDAAAMVCPADDLCERFGGKEVCAETAYEDMYPYYGRGLLTGSEYLLKGSSFWNFGGDYGDDDDDDDEISANGAGKKVQQADRKSIVKEMIRRSHARAKGIIHDISMEDGDSTSEERASEGDAFLPPPPFCDEERMAHRRDLCRDTIQACFGHDGDDYRVPHARRLASDLEARICQPLACHHRLHRMAGHVARHVLELSDEWNDHHDHSLGIGGWLFVVALFIFYTCVVAGCFGEALDDGSEDDGGSRGILPTRSSVRKKQRIVTQHRRKHKYT